MAKNKETEALQGNKLVVGADMQVKTTFEIVEGYTNEIYRFQVRRILASRNRSKTKSRLAKALERSSSMLQRQENMELGFECAVRKCLNSQLMVTAKHQVCHSLQIKMVLAHPDQLNFGHSTSRRLGHAESNVQEQLTLA